MISGACQFESRKKRMLTGSVFFIANRNSNKNTRILRLHKTKRISTPSPNEKGGNSSCRPW